jgi:DNA-binding MarR family transcriptional regulator
MTQAQTPLTSSEPRPESEAAVRAFTRLLRASASTTRLLSAELLEEHGLTINDYEALLVLSHADGQRLKRVDISRQLLLTPSGITRLLEGLEAEGLVERESCPSDLRITYACLTEAGARRLQAASCAHVASITALFEEHLDESEITALADTLDKLPGVAGTDGACNAG